MKRRFGKAFQLPSNNDRPWHVLHRIRQGLTQYQPNMAPCTRMISLLFPSGIMTHGVLAAAMRNPTVRLRYASARKVLYDLDMQEDYEFLLYVAGFHDISSITVKPFLHDMEKLFDTISQVKHTVFPFSGDLEPAMRRSAIDDSYALIDRGEHREALFWICVTYARLMQQARADLKNAYDAHINSFSCLANCIGIGTIEDEASRATHILATLPRLEALCLQVMKKSRVYYHDICE